MAQCLTPGSLQSTGESRCAHQGKEAEEAGDSGEDDATVTEKAPNKGDPRDGFQRTGRHQVQEEVRGGLV